MNNTRHLNSIANSKGTLHGTQFIFQPSLGWVFLHAYESLDYDVCDQERFKRRRYMKSSR